MWRTWWCHQMTTFSALVNLCEGNPSVTGGFPSQRPVTRSFHVFFDLRLNKRLSKQSRGRWFETPVPISSHPIIRIRLKSMPFDWFSFSPGGNLFDIFGIDGHISQRLNKSHSICHTLLTRLISHIWVIFSVKIYVTSYVNSCGAKPLSKPMLVYCQLDP